MIVRFTVPGEPKGKGRPRFTSRGGYPRVYTSAETTAYENKVRFCYITNCHKLKFEGSIALTAICYFPIPKSTTKKQKELMLAGKVYHTKRPDVDNCIKSLLDGLNGVAFVDDKQIAEICALKLYSDEPRVELTIEDIPRSDEW